MQVVINTCFGGFGLSQKAIQFIAERKNVRLVEQAGIDGEPEYFFYLANQPFGEPIVASEYDDLWSRNDVVHFSDLDRTDDDLITAVQELGDAVNGDHAELKIVEIPDDVEWQLEEYDGSEWIAEKHRIWN